MFHHLSILAITATLINSVPIDNSKTITDDIIEDNIINVDEQPEKQVEERDEDTDADFTKCFLTG